MSTRWHNLPCAACAKDTIHYAGKCRECGALFVTPSQHRAKSYRRHAVYTRFGKTPRHAFTEAKAALDAIRGAGPDFLDHAARGGAPIGGYGRQRTKV